MWTSLEVALLACRIAELRVQRGSAYNKSPEECVTEAVELLRISQKVLAKDSESRLQDDPS